MLYMTLNAKDIEELQNLERKSHPTVLEVRRLLCAHEKIWRDALAEAEPELASNPEDSSGWLRHAYALRRVDGGSLNQAWKVLMPALEKFPTEPVIFRTSLVTNASWTNRMKRARGFSAQ
jgi:hypothetical protein